MDKLTYRQAYDKIIDAYFKDQMEPYEPNFCFCGNLCDNTNDWFYGMPSETKQPYAASHGYSGGQLYLMEQALLRHVAPGPYLEYEDDLFKGMSAALDVLKEIHRSRGENVDEDIPAFTKRQLAKAI